MLVFIVPHYVMSEEMANYLCRHFSNLTAWSAPERQFKQMVVFGIKRRPAAPSRGQVEALMAVKDTLPPELPEAWPHALLLVPEAVAGDDLVFQALRLNGPELASEIVRHHASTLWPVFPRTFSAQAQAHRRPLRMLSDWHLALGLAAGQIGGFVSSQDGRTYLIKGATHKEKEVSVQHETDAKGNVSETRVLTDRFVPVIRAIDFTDGSPTFGEVLTIR